MKNDMEILTRALLSSKNLFDDKDRYIHHAAAISSRACQSFRLASLTSQHIVDRAFWNERLFLLKAESGFTCITEMMLYILESYTVLPNSASSNRREKPYPFGAESPWTLEKFVAENIFVIRQRNVSGWIK